MKNPFDLLQQLLENESFIFLIANLTVVLSIIILLFAILIDFVLFHKTAATKQKIKSPVDTGTMLLFFCVYYLLMNMSCGKIIIQPGIVLSLLQIVGTLLILLGCVVNVTGRFQLKSNWANQVTIYKNQTLITRGVYRLARHPLYASIIWMLIGGCFVYLDYIALLSVLLLFMPIMRYRAKQEEDLLLNEFPEYANYKTRVWMFSPKLF